MANYIPYTQSNMFLWYEGNDPDRATPFNGFNLNLPLRQLEENDEALDQTIKDFEEGNRTATHLRTTDLDVSNSILLNSMFFKNSSKTLNLTDDADENTITLHTYKVDVTKIKLNGLNVDYNDETMSLTDDDGNYKNIKVEKLDVNEIDFRDIPSTLQVQRETVGEDDVDFLDFKSAEGYKQSFLRTGSVYAINNYYNFGSQDLQDALVYDDDNDSDTANSFLFYADGEVENSTVYAGDFKSVGADIAEYYSADKNYECGTILEIGGEEEMTEYNGGPLGGVVSEKPGYALNGNNKYKIPVIIALKGRVEVKIEGSAKRGQYIVAYKNGKGIAKDKKDLTFTDDIVGIALNDGTEKVLIKV